MRDWFNYSAGQEFDTGYSVAELNRFLHYLKQMGYVILDPISSFSEGDD